MAVEDEFIPVGGLLGGEPVQSQVIEDEPVWRQEDPNASAVVLLGRLQEAEPDRFSRAHLRTLQRRVQQWRGIMAKKLVTPRLVSPWRNPLQCRN